MSQANVAPKQSEMSSSDMQALLDRQKAAFLRDGPPSVA